MKKVFYLLFAVLPFIAAGCGKDGNDEPDAPEVSLSVSPSNLSLLSSKDAQVSFNVRSNGEWVIANVPEWINLSATSGIGDAEIKVTALSANSDDKERKAMFTVKSIQTVSAIDGGTGAPIKKPIECEVTVTQLPAFQSNCRVEAVDIFTLANSMCCSFSMQSGVSYFYVELLGSAQANWPDSKIVETLMQNTLWDREYAENYSAGMDDIEPDTDYWLCIVAFDAQGNQGPLTKTRIHTEKLPANYPWVTISGVQFTEDGSSAYFSKNPSTSGYYVLILMDDYGVAMSQSSLAFVGRALKSYIEGGTFTLWANDARLYSQLASPDCVFNASWGLDALGNFSPVINTSFTWNSARSSVAGKSCKKSSGLVAAEKKVIEKALRSAVVIRK